MKKVIIILITVLILFGCKKNPMPSSNTNNTTIIDEPNETNETYIKIFPDINETDLSKDIDFDGNKDEKRTKIFSYMYILGTEVYNQKIYTKYAKEGDNYKVYVSDLKKSKYDISIIETLCGKNCKIDEMYFLINETNTENPFEINVQYYDDKQEEDPDPIKKVLDIAIDIYKNGKYTEAKKVDDYYETTIAEFKSLFGYDISELKCKEDTIIRFYPNESTGSTDYPIRVEKCDVTFE